MLHFGKSKNIDLGPDRAEKLVKLAVGYAVMLRVEDNIRILENPGFFGFLGPQYMSLAVFDKDGALIWLHPEILIAAEIVTQDADATAEYISIGILAPDDGGAVKAGLTTAEEYQAKVAEKKIWIRKNVEILTAEIVRLRPQVARGQDVYEAFRSLPPEEDVRAALSQLDAIGADLPRFGRWALSAIARGVTSVEEFDPSCSAMPYALGSLIAAATMLDPGRQTAPADSELEDAIQTLAACLPLLTCEELSFADLPDGVIQTCAAALALGYDRALFNAQLDAFKPIDNLVHRLRLSIFAKGVSRPLSIALELHGTAADINLSSRHQQLEIHALASARLKEVGVLDAPTLPWATAMVEAEKARLRTE